MSLFRSLLNEPRSWVIVITNLYVLYGIFELGWSVFSVVVLFWAENIIIGFFNVLKLITYRKPMTFIDDKASPIPQRVMTSLIWFGVFLAFSHVHAIFVHHLFAEGLEVMWSDGLYMIQDIINERNMAFALCGIAGSYAFEFIYNYLNKNERDETMILALTMGPFFKVAILHFVIIFGGIIIGLFGAPMVALVLLVILKILVELVTHKLNSTVSEKFAEIQAGAKRNRDNKTE